ncbi:magnesium chelatase domain-containing protein [Streptomyces sp. NPDC088253]|uniref:magnesium chelatase domain-containing protein n=1 Tax=Streptomyces sp. NPDC088253 TaxID=3365846 RepID=UPI00380A3CCA
MNNRFATDHRTAVLSQACEGARTAALAAQKAFALATRDYATALLRKELPDAAFMTVDTVENELFAIRDAQGKTLWAAPSTPFGPLPDSVVEDIDALFRELAPLGGFSTAGGKESSRGQYYMEVRLPDPEESAPAKPAAATGVGRARVPAGQSVAHIRATVEPGKDAFHLTGSGTSLEAHDRVRASLINSGYKWPLGTVRVSVDCSPNQPRGAMYDLGIACAILAAAGQLNQEALNGVAVMGELGLDGQTRPVHQVNDAIRAARADGCHAVVLAEANLDAVDVADIGVYGVVNLRTAVDLLHGQK